MAAEPPSRAASGIRQIRTEYQYRVEHVEARPAPTFAAPAGHRRAAPGPGRGCPRAGNGPPRIGPSHPEANHRLVPVRARSTGPNSAQRQAPVREVQQSRARVEAAGSGPGERPPRGASRPSAWRSPDRRSRPEPRSQSRGPSAVAPPPIPKAASGLPTDLPGPGPTENPAGPANRAEPVERPSTRPRAQGAPREPRARAARASQAQS